jgi:hypothetical protein
LRRDISFSDLISADFIGGSGIGGLALRHRFFAPG